MLPKEKYKNLHFNKMTMSESSYAKEGDPSSAMVESDIQVIKLDQLNGLVNVYNREFNSSSTVNEISAVDALYIDKNNQFYFIEFKSGKLSNIKNSDIHKKILNSLIVCQDIYDINLDYTRLNAFYIVVCSIPNTEASQELTRPHRNVLQRRHNLNPIIKFDLEKHKNSYFKDIHTLNISDFGSQFLQTWQSQHVVENS
jgi:hypothetical protein